MKQIIAIVKPFLVEKILEALRRAPLEAVSVAEVKGMGKQKSYLDRYSQNEYSLAFLPKVEICLWVEDGLVAEAVKRISEIARSGRMGDGKIFVMPVPLAVDIASYTPGQKSTLFGSSAIASETRKSSSPATSVKRTKGK